jgi:YtoQ family protein
MQESTHADPSHADPIDAAPLDLAIYLAGEIHSDWRDRFRDLLASRGIEAIFLGPQEDHGLSDDIGEKILGKQPGPRYRDLQGARVNTLRTRVHLRHADLVVACFTEKYRQWNTAADAGQAVAAGIPLVLVRPEEHVHALKELDALADLTVETLEQAAEAVAYITRR